jgi:hypothetical protein
MIECVSVQSVGGNTTVEISTNGRDFSAPWFSEMLYTNVTDLTPTVVPVIGGASIVVRGAGFSAPAMDGVYCLYGASTAAETWSHMAGTLISTGSIRCAVPARGAGFRALEVSLTKDGAMTRGGLQVMFVTIGAVDTVSPSVGYASGGSVITVTGTGFVDGITACKFGSASRVAATVISSNELRCINPVGSFGVVTLEVSLGDNADAALSVSGKQFSYVYDLDVQQLPRMVLMDGGSVMPIAATGVSHGQTAWCMFGGNTIVKATVNSAIVECISVAGTQGNVTVEVSSNGQDFSTNGYQTHRLPTNVTLDGTRCLCYPMVEKSCPLLDTSTVTLP